MRFLKLPFLIQVFTISVCMSQTDSDVIGDADWGEGTIMLQGGSVIEGLIRFDEKREIISFEKGKDSRTLTASKIIGFEYFDSRINKQRVFFSIAYAGELGTSNGIFELVTQFSDFDVLKRISPIEFEVKSSRLADAFNDPTSSPLYQPRTQNKANTVRSEQVETIYFANGMDKVVPVLEITYINVERGVFDRTAQKSKLVEKDVLKSFFGEYYDRLKSYANSKNLDFENKEDLILVLEQFEKLREN